MKASNNNRLRKGASFSLFVTSYIPLFAIVIAKQLWSAKSALSWGGWNKEAFYCFMSNFGMSVLLGLVSIGGVIGMIILLMNLEKNLPNGSAVKVTKINNRNSEAVGYIATYIVPFMAGDLSSCFECIIFVIVMSLIYVIYINSNLILINPILCLRYSLLEIEYKVIGDNSDTAHEALIITNTKDFRENVNYQI